TTIALKASASSPSPVETAAGFSYAWNVTKNGGAFANGNGPSFTFTPDGPGTFTVSLTATDQAGTVSAAVTKTISVDDVPPTATISGAPTSSSVGTSITLIA